MQKQPRRIRGRLRPLTNAERDKRQARRERNNPAREARLATMATPAPVAVPRRRLVPDWFARAARAARG